MAEESEQSISASLFGQNVAAKGTQGIIILVLLCSTLGAGWLLWDRSNKDERNAAAIIELVNKQSNVLSEHASGMLQDHRMMTEASLNTSRQLKIQNWIILSDPKDRENIKRKMSVPLELQ